jgi:tRNA G18 (ribose-2'-O)-methylase SpoU
VNIEDVEYDNKTCIFIGNEGKGVDQEIIDISNKNIHIKINDRVESLNASVAASIVMYEVRNRIL